jgi:thioredoxin-related protein
MTKRRNTAYTLSIMAAAYARSSRFHFTILSIAIVSIATLSTAHLNAKNIEQQLPALASIPKQGAEANARGEGLIVLVSLPGCPHCERVRRDELLPRQAAGQQSFQLNIGSNEPLTDGAGKATTHAALARQLKVKIAPTVLLLAANGELLAEPLVGAGIADFYGAYLDERIAAARAKLSAERLAREPK